MLLVNTVHSYPAVANALTAATTHAERHMALHQLEEITRGDWPDLSDKTLAKSADAILGSSDGLITVAYEVRSWKRSKNAAGVTKLIFEVASDPKLAWLIGLPQPGGPWRRGEARGTRQVQVDPAWAVDRAASGPTWDDQVMKTARHLSPRDAPPELAQVHQRPDGTWVVTVPAGDPVLIRPRP